MGGRAVRIATLSCFETQIIAMSHPMLKHLHLSFVLLFLAAPAVAKETGPIPTWAARLDAAKNNDALAADRDRLIAKARKVAALPTSSYL